jgi:hypothetical protein
MEDCFGDPNNWGLCPQNPPFESPAMKEWRRLGIKMFGQRDYRGRDIVSPSDTDYLAINDDLGEIMEPDKQLPPAFLQAARSIFYCPQVIFPIALRQTGKTLDSFGVEYPCPLFGTLRTAYLASWSPIRSPFLAMLSSVHRLSLAVFEDCHDQQESLRAEQNLTRILESIDNPEELALVGFGHTEWRQAEVLRLGGYRLGLNDTLFTRPPALPRLKVLSLDGFMLGNSVLEQHVLPWCFSTGMHTLHLSSHLFERVEPRMLHQLVENIISATILDPPRRRASIRHPGRAKERVRIGPKKRD